MLFIPWSIAWLLLLIGFVLGVPFGLLIVAILVVK